MSDNKAQATAKKLLGNEALKVGDTAAAIQHYTDGIALDPSSHVLYSNRSGAHLTALDGDKALADAELCIQKNGAWPKGHARKGAALRHLKRHDEAIAAYERAVAMAPNDAWSAEINAIKKEQKGPGLFGPEGIARLMMHPETKEYMSDPDFQQKLALLQQDPQNMSAMQSDPRIMKALSVMLGMDLGGGAAPQSKPEPKKPEPKPEPEPVVELSDEEKAQAAIKADADKEKALGAAAYKQKKFAEALGHFEKAAEILPTDMSYLSNQGSVYMEMKEYAKCIEKCEAAYEVGKEQREDYKMLAKVLARMGTAYERSGDLQTAVHWYKKSLTEDRNAVVLKKRQDCEKAIKDAEKNAYFDVGKAEEAKQEGNAHFKEGRFPEAVKSYTEAIQRNPEDAKLYRNRAACYIKLLACPHAVDDCNECIKLDPTFVKGYTSKGDALFLLKRVEEAKMAYNKALALDQSNASARDGILRCAQAIKAKEADMTTEEKRERAMKDPEVIEIMRDPVMNTVLTQMQEDPRAAQEHMKNPDIAAKIQKLMEAGIIGYK